MAITLTHATTTLVLPDALDWTDEYSWSPVQQSKQYTTTGALLIEEFVKQAGRPITLNGRADATWCKRENVDQLRAWAATAGIVLTLLLRGVARQVTFDHERGALTGFPVVFFADGHVAADDWYVPTVRLIEI